MGKIFKQSSFLILAQGFARLVGFFYTIYIARVLGVDNFGLYSAALAFFALASTASELGFNRYIVREVALGNLPVESLIGNVALLRLTFTSVLFAIFALIFRSLDPDKLRVCLMLLATIAVLPVAIGQTLDGVFTGLKKLQFVSLALALGSLAGVFSGVLLVSNGFGATGAVVGLMISQSTYALALVFFLQTHRIRVSLQTNLKNIKKIIYGSLPYGILGVLGLLYFRIDTLMLSYLKGNFDTGIYGAAYKFLEALVFIPTSLSSAIFPVMAKLHEGQKEGIKEIYFKSMKLMGLLGILVIIGYFLILPTILKWLLPAYLPAIEVIKILSLSAPFMFIHVPASQVLLSSEKYLKPLMLLSLLPLTFNVVLNFIFIPQFGFWAAAWITVASDVVSAAMILTFTQKYFFNNEYHRS